jgi:hypothetical protein
MAHNKGTNGHQNGNQNGGWLSRFFKQDLGSSPLLKTSWDEAASADSLDTVYEHVMTQTSKSIDWYLKAKKVKKWCARFTRIYAVMGGAVAAGLPTLAEMYPEVFTYLRIKAGSGSALILGTIAAFVLLDRFFGFSSGWVRFTRTQLHLRQIAQEFQMDWEVERASLQGKPPTQQHTLKMLARCKTFVIQVNTIVREETDAWIQEFQESLKMIDDSTKPKSAGSEPGALNLTVVGGDQSNTLKGSRGWTLTVDDGPSEVHQGTKIGIPGMLPGRRHIKVEGKIDDQSVKDEKVINVPAGGICEESLKLT